MADVQDKELGPHTTILRPIVQGLTALGLRWRDVFEAGGLDPSYLEKTEGRIPLEAFLGFWPAAAHYANDPLLGLHVGEKVKVRAVTLAIYLMMTADTAREGLLRVARYQRVVFGARWMEVLDERPTATVRVSIPELDAETASVQIQYSVMAVIKVLDWATETELRASEVRFEHTAPEDSKEYERILHCPVRFGAPATEIRISAKSLDQPSVHANAEVARIAEEYARNQLARIEDHSISGRVRAALAARLEDGAEGVSRLARRLHMSSRTLQRRLSEEGTSYRRVLDTLRRDLSIHHLREKGSSLAEIAYLCGLSDPATFTRAVRRWTGTTPLRFRRSRTAGPDGDTPEPGPAEST